MINMTDYELIEICANFRCWGRILRTVGRFKYESGLATCDGLIEPLWVQDIGEEGMFTQDMMRELASALISADIAYNGVRSELFYEIAEQFMFWTIGSKKFNPEFLRGIMEKSGIPIDIASKAVSIYRIPDICPSVKTLSEEEQEKCFSRLQKRRWEIRKILGI